MCGIVYKHNYDKSKPVNNDVLQQFDKQRRRGTQGFGVFDGQHHKMFKSAREDEILDYLCKHDSNMLLFHHRLPTSTINVAQAAHPVRTKKYFGNTEYILVHNGSIRNPNELFVRHQEKGMPYQTLLQDLTFNDSESLMWDLALTLEGRQKKMKAYGNMAFIMLKLVNGKPHTLYAGRNIYPLNMYKGEDSIEISSEGPGVPLPPDMLTMFDFRTRKFTMKKMEFPQHAEGYKPVEYNHSSTVRNSGFSGKESTYGNGYKPTEYFPGKKKEYQSYDEFIVEKRKASAESNWERLRAKFGKHLALPASTASTVVEGTPHEQHLLTSISEILEAKKDEDGRFEVVENHNPHVDIDDVIAHKQMYEPSSGEIQNCAMDYMVQAQGIFEDAYAILEIDYMEYMSECRGKETMADMRQMLLMEAAMEFINSDPEYQNEESKSSIWEALWSKKQLRLTAA